MVGKGIVLATNQNSIANVGQQMWSGGRASLVIVGTAYPSACALQILAPDNLTWVNVTANITANGVYPVDCPAGQYRLGLSGTGSATAIYASLVSVQYA